MRRIIIVVLFALFSLVLCKNNVKTLDSKTDSMGQEVIEISGPKELPPGLEEEPGAESDDDDPPPTTITTKKDNKKTSTLPETRKNMKDVEKIDGASPEDEETRLEKELAEIYKDTDYKDSAEDFSETKDTTTISTTTIIMSDEEEKPIARSRNNFKFAPDTTDKKEIEKFRTSVDDISCKNRQKLSVTTAITQVTGRSDLMKKLNMAIFISNLSVFVIMI